jgi:CheY-like chemotaxis protein
VIRSHPREKKDDYKASGRLVDSKWGFDVVTFIKPARRLDDGEVMSPYEKYGARRWLEASAHAIARGLQVHEATKRAAATVSPQELGRYIESWLALRLGESKRGEHAKERSTSANICENLMVRRVLIEMSRREMIGGGIPPESVDALFAETDRRRIENTSKPHKGATVTRLKAGNPKIASLDDSRTWQAQLRARVPESVEILAAADWPALVEVLCANVVDLVLLDLYMPEPDGLECLARLRADPRFSHLSIALCTSRPTEAARLRARSLGAIDVLGKSEDAEVFSGRIHDMLNLVGQIAKSG